MKQVLEKRGKLYGLLNSTVIGLYILHLQALPISLCCILPNYKLISQATLHDCGLIVAWHCILCWAS